jgi:hypothetical protein
VPFSASLWLWTVYFDGLTNGSYDVYVYAPYDMNIASGDVLVNGTALAPFPGDLLTRPTNIQG